MIGILGPLTFIAPMQGGLLLNKFSKTLGVNFDAHKIYGGIPQPEFVGHELVKASITLQFLQNYTVDPAKGILGIDLLTFAALPLPFLIGGVPVSPRGASLFVIRRSEPTVRHWAGSVIISSETKIELEEYPISLASAIQGVISAVENVASQIGL